MKILIAYIIVSIIYEIITIVYGYKIFKQQLKQKPYLHQLIDLIIKHIKGAKISLMVVVGVAIIISSPILFIIDYANTWRRFIKLMGKMVSILRIQRKRKKIPGFKPVNKRNKLFKRNHEFGIWDN